MNIIGSASLVGSHSIEYWDFKGGKSPRNTANIRVHTCIYVTIPEKRVLIAQKLSLVCLECSLPTITPFQWDNSVEIKV